MPSISQNLLNGYETYISAPIARIPYVGKGLSKALDVPVFTTLIATNVVETITRLALGVILLGPALIAAQLILCFSKDLKEGFAKSFRQQFGFIPQASDAVLVRGRFGINLMVEIFQRFFGCSTSSLSSSAPTPFIIMQDEANESEQFEFISERLHGHSEAACDEDECPREVYAKPPQITGDPAQNGSTLQKAIPWRLSKAVFARFASAIPPQHKTPIEGSNDFYYQHPLTKLYYRISTEA